MRAHLRRRAAGGRKPLAQMDLFIQIHKATPSTFERLREMAAQLIDLRLPAFIAHQLAARRTRSRILQRAFDLALEFIGAAGVETTGRPAARYSRTFSGLELSVSSFMRNGLSATSKPLQ